MPAPSSLSDLVQWFWIPEWDIEPGRTSRQHLIPFPASNLVVETGGVTFSGPATQAAHRDLSGRGWAVGALLRPAAVPTFTNDPTRLRDDEIPVDLPELERSVTEAMDGQGGDERRQRAVDAFVTWFAYAAITATDEGRTANRMMDVIAGEPGLTRMDDLAERLFVSPRTVQRLARKYIGLSPSALIRRRRLQDAAQRSRIDPTTDLAAIAAELGYADHAHLTNDFRSVLGLSPSDYRRSVGDDRS